ncbi:hypothetical protein H6G89_05875 [Oscillatoria sp. FACHB-1407]|uniref:hypothetical protein n=1 Tax=Oscillatoria sp. FACHB-1407 TaxID=2692847 RepID=UPI0016876A2B|nr:hypothetical protein [Oscillatoria sp. FACHB-1407]MBD2460568.1 hypothetical protein [Oscillatoria sp. FACHB-1407]
MTYSLDETLSVEVAQQIKSKAKTPFENAHRAALATDGATYVQGFAILAGKSAKIIEHGWIEVGDRVIDPTFPYLNKSAKDVHYFGAQRLSVKQLKAAIEEAQEDYPEDPPLPVYGSQPYEYYGDVMLGGKEYMEAYTLAQATLKAL